MITYRTSRNINRKNLRDLFLSVNWDSGNHPAKLVRAIAGSHHVVTAWHDNRLVGLMNALSDGVMTTYFHYLLVHPAYQRKKIGTALVKKMLAKYKNCETKVLISHAEAVKFYMACGYVRRSELTPMFVTSLTL